jgi:hypothetical protein
MDLEVSRHSSLYKSDPPKSVKLEEIQKRALSPWAFGKFMNNPLSPIRDPKLDSFTLGVQKIYEQPIVTYKRPKIGLFHPGHSVNL